MNTTLNTLLAVFAVAATVSAVPVVSDVTMTQNPYNTHVTIKYRLTGDPGARGNGDGLNWPSYRQDGSFDYELSHGVRSTSTLGKLRAMTGLAFDLPTEHQWEFACRAGSPGTIYTDTTPTLILSVSDADTVATMKRICRYSANNTRCGYCSTICFPDGRTRATSRKTKTG